MTIGVQLKSLAESKKTISLSELCYNTILFLFAPILVSRIELAPSANAIRPQKRRGGAGTKEPAIVFLPPIDLFGIK